MVRKQQLEQKNVSTTFTISKQLARIGINTRFLIPGKLEGFGWYTYEVVKRIVEKHPEHDFVFFFDRPFDPSFIFAPNVQPVVISPPARHPFLFILWFEFLLPKALKKYKIDLFFSPDGYVSLKTGVPQIATIHDINFEHYPEDLPLMARWYLRKYFPKFAQKASHILTVSEFSKKDICTTYGIDSKNITSVWNSSSDLFVPINENSADLIRSKYSNGDQYFLFVGSIHPRKNLRRLIEAYIQYSQSVNDPWRFVIVGASMWKGGNDLSIPEDVSHLIHFTGRVDQKELIEIVGAAGALAYVPYFEGFGIPLVEAMKCGVPILAGDKSCLPEIAGDAAIYCDPFSIIDIQSGLTELSSNEELRKELSVKALQRSMLFSWDVSAKKIWEVLENYL